MLMCETIVASIVERDTIIVTGEGHMRKIILDVDTGTDDAIAIMAAIQAPNIEVVALCSVFGNTDVSNTTSNTLRAAYAAGGENIPVYAGACEPMVKSLTSLRQPPVEEPVLAGVTVIDGVPIAMNPEILPLPESPRKPETMEAPLFYMNYLRKVKEKITLVLTGALTNFALALTMDPMIISSIEEIVIMGGGVQKSNITAAAEANFFKDPEAAAIVLQCGAPITICTLDATHSCGLTKEHEEKIRSIRTPAAIFTANDIRVRRESYNRYQPMERADSAPIHDALCIIYLAQPSVVLKAEMACCDVDCSDGISEGHLQVDQRYFHGRYNAKLVLRADPDKMCGALVDIFQRGKSNI